MIIIINCIIILINVISKSLTLYLKLIDSSGGWITRMAD
jgi:hypothetical protein